MSHGHDSHDSHSTPAAPEVDLPPPAHVVAIARIAARIGQALIAAGLLVAVVLWFQFCLSPSVFAAAFASLYGFCILLASRATIARASHR